VTNDEVECGTDNDHHNEVFEPSLDGDLAASRRVTNDLMLRGSVLYLLAEDPPIYTGAGMLATTGQLPLRTQWARQTGIFVLFVSRLLSYE